MKILVTGANGQIGKAIVRKLKERGNELLGLSHSELDITDKLWVNKTLHDYQPDIVINAAAYTAVDLAESNIEKTFAINRDGIANLASICAQLDIAIFHLSSDYVFSGTISDCYNENHSTDPINIYGKSKLAGEHAAAIAPKHLVLRTAWVFSEHYDNFVSRLLRMGQSESQLDIVYDQIGSPTYAGDIASTFAKIIDCYIAGEQIHWGTYHYAGYPRISRFELARYLFQQAQQLGLYSHSTPHLNPVISANYSSAAKRPLNTCLCCNKIEREFGIMPSRWQTAIDQLLASSLTP